MRAVLGHCAGGGLRLPHDKAPSTVAQRVIHYFGPEPWRWGSGTFALRVGRDVGMGGCIAGCAHPLEKSGPSIKDASIHRLPYEQEKWLRFIALCCDAS